MPGARREFSACFLGPADVSPVRPDFEVIGAFNPGAIEAGGETILLVRMAERPKEKRQGAVGLPRWDSNGEIAVDWIAESELEAPDPRVVRLKKDGSVRLTFISYLKVVRSANGREIVSVDGPVFAPARDYEEFGIEDPRIVFLDGRFYFTYVAVSRHGAATALASTGDFKSFERHGIIFPPENKDVLLFPEKVWGRYLAIHRPNPATHFHPPEMWLAESRDLINWGAHRPLYGGGGSWESGRVGGGAPPLRVPEGWLEIYHGNQPFGGAVGQYAAGALLLDGNDPGRVLKVAPEPVMVPEEEFERKGFVSGVVFPTGVIPEGDSLRIYYGAADTSVGVASLSLAEVLGSLKS